MGRPIWLPRYTHEVVIVVGDQVTTEKRWNRCQVVERDRATNRSGRG